MFFRFWIIKIGVWEFGSFVVEGRAFVQIMYN